MASSHCSVGNKQHSVVFAEDSQKRVWNLIIDIRLPHYYEDGVIPTSDELKTIEAKTIGNWSTAMHSHLFGSEIADKHNISAIEALPARPNGTEVTVSKYEPYVTVWNRNDIRISMNSNTTPRDAADLITPYLGGIELFDKYREKYGLLPVGETPTPQAPQNKAAQDADWLDSKTEETRQAPQQNAVLSNVWKRSTRKGIADGLISLETGKKASPKFEVQAKMNYAAYDYNVAVDNATLFAYPLSGEVSIRLSQNSKIGLVLGVHAGNSIWIWKKEDTVWDGKTIPSDWRQALSALGLWYKDDDAPNAAIQVGYTARFEGNVLCVMKFAPNKQDATKSWQNFYGLYDAQAAIETTIAHQTKLDNEIEETLKTDDIPF